MPRRKVHFGSRGGRYIIKNGKKKYLKRNNFGVPNFDMDFINEQYAACVERCKQRFLIEWYPGKPVINSRLDYYLRIAGPQDRMDALAKIAAQQACIAQCGRVRNRIMSEIQQRPRRMNPLVGSTWTPPTRPRRTHPRRAYSAPPASRLAHSLSASQVSPESPPGSYSSGSSSESSEHTPPPTLSMPPMKRTKTYRRLPPK